jgi:6,7-dimethyl-8-ribityllumazine synthase|tara:strand:- start:462 stop:926 length:465 start_codon:yes stop_codon:yes gene_type:complete
MSSLAGKKIALVVSTFYSDLAEKMVEGAAKKFVELGGSEDALERFYVPGCFEIPQATQKVVDSSEFDAVVCFGVVIRGETAHFDSVCENVTRGVGEVAQTADIPVIFGVLTTNNHQQAEERLGGSKGHKGEQAMEAALKMMETLEKVAQKTKTP